MIKFSKYLKYLIPRHKKKPQLIIRKVFFLSYTKQKLVGIPKDSEIKAGDYVKIIKVEEDG